MILRSLLAAALLLTIAQPLPAQAGIIEFLFPTLKKKEPNPGETLLAPFADAENNAEQSQSEKVASLPENAIPLDKPHRVTSDITKWVETATAEVMNFTSQNYQNDLSAAQKLFDNGGNSQYTTFLRDKNIMKVLESGRYKVNSHVEDTPLLLNEGVVQGRYRWLYQIPVMITYIDRNASGYEDAKPINQKAQITLQVGRSKDAENADALLIERWSGKVKSDTAKSK